MEKFENIENKTITIRELLKNKNTIDQLDILARADKMFPEIGRYYGGILTDEQIVILDPKRNEKNSKSSPDLSVNM